MSAAAAWIRRLALIGAILCFGVVVLGAYVRLTAAGLGCPDWPGCYGHFTPAGAEENIATAQQAWPNSPFDAGKAWREMIHRYAAGTLGLIITIIAALSITAATRERAVGIPYALLLFGTVVFQGVLGMLTVTWQLKPLIVTLHLLFGLTTLGLLWWLWLSLSHTSWAGLAASRAASPLAAPSRSPRLLIVLALVALGVQIALGGWTSSNYAAVACPDFPTCQNSWIPEMNYSDAFVLWRGLGINYEGGVLDHPARVAIHFTHRVGAIVATVLLVIASWVVFRRRSLVPARWAAGAVLFALVLQLVIGISMVELAFPLWLATLHNAGAAFLTLTVLTLLHRVSRIRSG
ncbi:MAG TPA: COX15/CtaA family protein [Steroidobacteraceae bacterium]